jgi:hypothetical protein
MRKIVCDSHLAAQEIALGIVLVFLECAPVPVASRVLKELLSPLVDKTFASTRATTKQRALDIVIMAVEIIENGDLVMVRYF